MPTKGSPITIYTDVPSQIRCIISGGHYTACIGRPAVGGQNGLKETKVWMDEIRSHRFETMVATIKFVGICREIDSFQGFFGGAAFCPFTV